MRSRLLCVKRVEGATYFPGAHLKAQVQRTLFGGAAWCCASGGGAGTTFAWVVGATASEDMDAVDVSWV